MTSFATSKTLIGIIFQKAEIHSQWGIIQTASDMPVKSFYSTCFGSCLRDQDSVLTSSRLSLPRIRSDGLVLSSKCGILYLTGFSFVH